MDRRVLLAIVLSFLILAGWQYLFPPPEPARRPVEPSTPPAAEAPARPGPAPEAETEPAAAPIEAVRGERAEPVPVETDLFDVTLTSQGGRISAWRLKHYSGPDGKPLDLVSGLSRQENLLPLGVDLGDPDTSRRVNEAIFQVEREAVEPTEDRGAGERVRFTWAEASGLRVVKSLVFRRGDYLVDVEVEATDRGRWLPARVTWGPGFAAGESRGGGFSSFHYSGQVVQSDRGHVTRFARGKIDEEVRYSVPGLWWAGLEEQYFAALIVPLGDGGGDVVIRPVVPGSNGAADNGKKGDAEMLVAIPVPEEGAQLFVGPKRFTLLKSLGRELEDVVWFSDFTLIAWLARWLFRSLIWIHDRVVPNYGLSVILLTVGLRLVLFPLNQHSMVSMKKMQVQMQRIQPKVNAIKQKYKKKKKDAEARAQMNQEVMALYKKEGVNPIGGMSGCLPMLAQFPILIAFYDVLIATVELRGAPFFGWIQDLTEKDPFYVTPLLMGATMFLQQKMTTTKTTDPAQRQQQKIMLMMPVVFTVMFLNLPSGLVLYWFVNNLLGIGQQWIVNRHIGRLEAAAQKA